uniref:Uncharacterized protein n=1 Tax=Glossina austeni TaxID=7395 RepID=A0A1A9UMJ2_GLOAU
MITFAIHGYNYVWTYLTLVIASHYLSLVVTLAEDFMLFEPQMCSSPEKRSFLEVPITFVFMQGQHLLLNKLRNLRHDNTHANTCKTIDVNVNLCPSISKMIEPKTY